MMNKKIIYLSLALLLPAIIFVFLKYFGKNEFDIPVYSKHGVFEISNSKESLQYFVPDSVLMKWKWSGSPALISSATENEAEVLKQLIADTKLIGIQLITLGKDDEIAKKDILFVKEPWNAVLVDGQKRIRGYYKLSNRDEMDRLEVELKILLKDY